MRIPSTVNSEYCNYKTERNLEIITIDRLLSINNFKVLLKIVRIDSREFDLSFLRFIWFSKKQILEIWRIRGKNLKKYERLKIHFT